MQIKYAQVEAIEIEEYKGPVFNLQTAKEEFVAEGIVVHNCPHLWKTNPQKVSKDECPNLWMG